MLFLAILRDSKTSKYSATMTQSWISAEVSVSTKFRFSHSGLTDVNNSAPPTLAAIVRAAAERRRKEEYGACHRLQSRWLNEWHLMVIPKF